MLVCWASLAVSGSAAPAPCQDSLPALWSLRQDLAQLVAAGNVPSKVQLTEIPTECDDLGAVISLATIQTTVDRWNAGVALPTPQAAWRLQQGIDLALAGLLGSSADTGVNQEFETALAAQEALVTQFQLLKFPIAPDTSRTFDEIFRDPEAFRQDLQQRWRVSERAEQQAVLLELDQMLEDLQDVGQGASLTLEPMLRPWITLRDEQLKRAGTTALLPTGQQNTEFYLMLVDSLATYAAHVRELRLRLTTSLSSRQPALTAADVNAIGDAVRPGRFTEPLQIPAASSTASLGWLEQWLRRLFGGSPIGGTLSRTMQILILVIAALLFGWLLSLLLAGSRWGNRAKQYALAGIPESVASGRHLSPDEQFRRAMEAARAGRQQEAMHWLTQGFIFGLAQQKLVSLDWSRTNREVLRDLQRQQTPLSDVARQFFRTAEGVVYGGREISLAAIEAAEQELRRALQIQESMRVHQPQFTKKV